MLRQESQSSGLCGVGGMGHSDRRVSLFTLSGLPKNNPITMLSSAVVGCLPSGIDNRRRARLYDAITRTETCFIRRSNQFECAPTDIGGGVYNLQSYKIEPPRE